MKNNVNYGRRQFIKKLTFGALSAPIFFAISSCSQKKTTESLSRIRMQSPWINDAEFIGYFVAINKGFYQKANVDYQYLSGGPEIVSDSMLLAKRAEIALTTPDVTINAIVQQNAPFKIIGAQYQKSPLGIVSLEKNHILEPKDLIGKTLAAPPANHLTVKAFLKINKIPVDKVRVVPYQYDPTPLINGEVDATLDFITNVPFTIKERGAIPTSFLLYDYGFKIFNDTVVVRNETLIKSRNILSEWLLASRKGWEDNFIDTSVYPSKFKDSFFKGTGRSTGNEVFFNKAQQPLIESSTGIYSMSEESINANIESLQAVGINAKREMFVNDLI